MSTDYPQLAAALHDVRAAGAEARGSMDDLQDSLARGRGACEEFVRGLQHGAVNLRASWSQALNVMELELGRWLDTVLSTTGAGGEALRAVGTLAGLLGSDAHPAQVNFAHPHIPHPAGALLPGEVATRLAPQLAVHPGAVQITAQTLDDDAITRAADLLATRLQERLAFEDGRQGFV